jgi:exodeoxyribonuclease V beta subunit
VSVRRVPRPAILERIPPDRSAVIEASAGTGKTFTLEHLVVDLLLSTDVTLDQILVVTFTEKATNELRVRVRATLDRLVSEGPEVESGEGPFWNVDDAARAKLRAARGAFETATITTIHAFCQRVLRDNAFFSGRLFEEHQVDGRDAFGRAFRDALRREVAPHPDRAPWLEAALRGGSSVAAVEELLWSCTTTRGEVRPAFDARLLKEALDAFPVDDANDLAHVAVLKKAGVHASTAGSMGRTMAALARAVVTAREAESLPLYVNLASDTDVASMYKLRGHLGQLRGATARLCAAAVALVDATPTFPAALAHTVLPCVRQELDRRKRDAGQYDFDDMLARVDEALGGPSGRSLAVALRRRWRYALIDEFQDTDEVQWRIFRRGFFEPGAGKSVVYLVGDPKQSIYRFRGADVETYLDARREVEASSGVRVALERSFRATPTMVDALNAVFDAGVAEPVFTGAVTYAPVECGRPDRALVDADGRAVGPLHVLRTEGTPTIEKIGPHVAREILAMTAPGRRWRLDGQEIAHSDVFVLTRSRFEGRLVGEHLRQAGIPYAFFKEDGLFQTEEAKDVRSLLRAIEDPGDRARRFAAWLTPFFGLSVEAHEDARELPASHPYVARLAAWKALAEAREYGRLFESIVGESGLVRREIFFGDGERELTNYSHIFELLLEHARRTRGTLRELVLEITGLIDKTRRPLDVEGDVQRIESERRAVQIMTIHKAKGLEAAVVFVVGGMLRGRGDGGVRVYHESGRRLAWIGPTGPHVKEAIKQEEREEDERLLYVALTRAKARLYLPCAVKGAGPHSLSGPYNVVNRRLVTLLRERPPWLSVEDVTEARPSRPPAALTLVKGAPSPRSDLLAPGPAATALAYAALRDAHAGTFATSYTRMRKVRARGGRTREGWLEHADARRAEKAAGAVDAPQAVALAGSRASGVFLHELLELVAVDSFAAPSFDAWLARPDVASLVDETMAVHRVDRSMRESAARMVWTAYTTPMTLPDGHKVAGLAKAEGLAREMDFVYPLPDSPLGFVRGSLDMAFEAGGKTYVVDWKSDTLGSYSLEALEKHTRAHYEDQVRLYGIAVVRLLGIGSRAAYESRFGGIVYCFLRGLDASGGEGRGFWSTLPTWDEVERWQRDLAEGAGWGAAAAVRSP